MSELHPVSAICTGPAKDEREADVVFVHGLMGDPFKTWRYGATDDTSWPHWLAATFPEIGVWTLGYPAALSKWPHWLRSIGGLFVKLQSSSASPGHAMALQRRAVSTLDRLTQKSIGQKPLIFVCHSLGGLLVKQVIHTAAMSQEPRETALAGSVRDVLFLATPHHGADMATLAKHLSTLLQASVVVDDLQAHGAHLESLSEDYKTYAKRFGIETHAYYETIGIAGSDTLVVNSTSANPGIGRRPVPLDRDHGSICKPRQSDDPVCERLREILQELQRRQQPSTLLRPDSLVETQLQTAASTLLPPVEVHVHVQPSPSQAADGPITPCQLPRAASRFFGREDEVKALVARLGTERMTVVAGAAGLGKTALAAEALRRMLSERSGERLAGTQFPHGIVYIDLYVQKDQPRMAWLQIAESVGGSDYLLDKTDDLRAREACRGRSLLLIVEGGEEADGGPCVEGGQRPNWRNLLDPLHWEGSLLWLTRPTPTSPRADIMLGKPLEDDEANDLLEHLTIGASTPPDAGIRAALVELLERHPLALTWAGGLLQRGGVRPQRLIEEFQQQPARTLHDPENTRHTLQWLFQRSVRLLDSPSRDTLAAAGLLAHAPFPLPAMCAATGLTVDAQEVALRQCVQSRLLDLDALPDHWRFGHALGHRFSQALAADLEEDQRSRLLPGLMDWADRQLQAEVAANLSLQTLAHAQALLQVETPPQGWQPLAQNLLYGHHERLEELGRLGECSTLLRLIEAWLMRMPAEEQDSVEWQRERSVIQNKLGDVLQVQGDLAGAQRRYEACLQISEVLASRDPENAGWQRDLSVSENKLGDVLQVQGDLPGAQRRYEAGLRIREALASHDPEDAIWQRDLSVSENKLGDILLAQGDLAGAQWRYEACLRISEALASRDPENVGWQRDLSVSFEKLGDVLQAQGDLTGAQRRYEVGLRISEALAASDPENAGWQRDLSVSENKQGDVLRVQGDLVGAQRRYEAGLRIREALASRDPEHAGWQRDLGVSENKLGDVLQVQGELAGAQQRYETCLQISEALASRDPENAVWQRDLSVSFEKLGEVLQEQGDLTGAQRRYEAGLRIREALASRDPENASWQRDLSVSENKLGDVLHAQGDLTGAQRRYEAGLRIREALVSRDPENAGWQRDLSVSENKQGDVLQMQGDLPGAQRRYEKCLQISEALASRDPENAGWQRDLAVSCIKMGAVSKHQGDVHAAHMHWQQAQRVLQRLVQRAPDHMLFRKDLAWLQQQIAELGL